MLHDRRIGRAIVRLSRARDQPRVVENWLLCVIERWRALGTVVDRVKG
jgi:hypothetical protein